jgi:serine protease
VGVFYADLGGNPLPGTSTVVCELTLRVRPNAAPGRARVIGVSPVCANVAAAPTSCIVLDGWVDVQGAPLIQSAGQWFEHDTLELDVLLYEGLAAPASGEAESAASLRSALGQRGLLLRNPPGHVRRAMGRPISPAEAAHYAAHPHLAGARLHRMLNLAYPDTAARDRALDELRASPAVEWVEPRFVPAMTLPPPRADQLAPAQQQDPGSKSAQGTLHQDHLAMLKVPQTWAIAGGWGLVAVVDTGIAVEHPELKSFTGPRSVGGSWIPGGNYLPYFSQNVAGRGQPVDNVDELLPTQLGQPGTVHPNCDPDGDGWAAPTAAGHGTHVSGLVGANSLDEVGVSGVCRGCGLAAVKATYMGCDGNNLLYMGFDFANGLASVRQSGVQVINLSGGSTATCSENSTHSLCVQTKAAHEVDIFVVAAAGNHRTTVQAPANSASALAAGGISLSGAIWDRSPGGNQNCPYYPINPGSQLECGGNYTTEPAPGSYSFGKQELVALASNVVSTVYPGHDWNALLGCGDSVGAGFGTDGFGECTGTSMSAPQIAGLVGLLRSVHPLLRVGAIDPLAPQNAWGLRKVLAETASLGQWDPKLGWGQIDAPAALARLLGAKDGERVRNRAIPLFSLLLSSSGDQVAVATPQLAMSLGPLGYIGDGEAIPGYPAFPAGGHGVPRARAFVLSTEYPPQSHLPWPQPLHLMVKPGEATRDHVLVVTPAQIQAASSAGYRYGGRQGYLYPDCTGQPGCAAPPGTELLHLRCRSSGGRCAVFPQRDSAQFTGLGYTQNFPGLSHSRLGYAYARGDADSDGLPDAAEYVLGTDPTLPDTDGDGVGDGVEYPFGELPVSDPCNGPLRHRCSLREGIFLNGFEE